MLQLYLNSFVNLHISSWRQQIPVDLILEYMKRDDFNTFNNIAVTLRKITGWKVFLIHNLILSTANTAYVRLEFLEWNDRLIDDVLFFNDITISNPYIFFKCILNGFRSWYFLVQTHGVYNTSQAYFFYIWVKQYLVHSWCYFFIAPENLWRDVHMTPQGPWTCLTTAIWCSRNPFSQWQHSFLKLRSHWLKFLLQRHVAVARQGPKLRSAKMFVSLPESLSPL